MFHPNFVTEEGSKPETSYHKIKDELVSDGNALWMINFEQKQMFMFNGMSLEALSYNWGYERFLNFILTPMIMP